MSLTPWINLKSQHLNVFTRGQPGSHSLVYDPLPQFYNLFVSHTNRHI